MLYRMKQNAAGLASICVLFTALLVTVSTTFSLYTSMDGLLRTRYPRNVLVSAQAASQDATGIGAHRCGRGDPGSGTARSRTWSTGRGGTSPLPGWGMSCTPKRCPSDAYAVVDIFTEREFERFSGQEVNLSEDQVLLFDPLGTFPEGIPCTSTERL